MSYVPPPYDQRPPQEQYVAAPYGAPPPAYVSPPAAYGAPPPQAAYAPAPPAYYYQPVAQHPDEVRTVFVTGFPHDVKERELNNLCRFLPGYEASQMHFKNDQAQGFALFGTGAMARAAVEALNHMVFDDGVVIRAEMARKNMYMREDAAPKRGRFDGVPAGAGAGAAPAGAGGRPAGGARDNPPCNTLFVGNLGEAASEAELHSIFANDPGFQQLKVVRGPRGISCFIEFIDIPTATAAHSAHQGAVLHSSADRGPLRVQFSKNPFGRKRDAYGNQLDHTPPQLAMVGPPGGDPAAGGYVQQQQPPQQQYVQQLQHVQHGPPADAQPPAL